MFGRRRRGHPPSESELGAASLGDTPCRRASHCRKISTYNDAADTAADQFVATTSHLIEDLNNDSSEFTLNELISCGVTKYYLPLLRRQLMKKNEFSEYIIMYFN